MWAVPLPHLHAAQGLGTGTILHTLSASALDPRQWRGGGGAGTPGRGSRVPEIEGQGTGGRWGGRL